MRNYNETEKTNGKLSAALRTLTVILSSLLMLIILTFISALIIKTTSVPESAESIIITVITALTAVIMTLILTRTIKGKPIIAALYSYTSIVIMKIILTEVIEKKISLSAQGIAGLIFPAIFCILGCMIGAYSKK